MISSFTESNQGSSNEPINIHTVFSAANIITFLRIPISISLLFLSPSSSVFTLLYSLAGFTDMTDGAVAKLTNSVSSFGSRLDTVADFIFVCSCCIKLLPLFNPPLWIFTWVAAIALIKAASVAYSLLSDHSLPDNHSLLNKLTGLLMFLTPFTLGRNNKTIFYAVVCLTATAAALDELFQTISDKK